MSTTYASVVSTLLGVSCCLLVDGASSSSNLFLVHFAGPRSPPSGPATDVWARSRSFFDVSFSSDQVSLSRFFRAFRSTSSSRSFFLLGFSLANAFTAFSAALAALRSFFNLLRSLRSSLVPALSTDFRPLPLPGSPLTSSRSPTCSGIGVDTDEGSKGTGADCGSSSGPNTAPLKNFEYRPRFAASLLAVARSDRLRPEAEVPTSVLAFGVVLPDVEAGVPEMGRRLEMMPVVVRWRGTESGSVREEGSWGGTRVEQNGKGKGDWHEKQGTLVSSTSSSSLDTFILIAFDAAANKLRG